jgi:hypothetical protein
MLLGVKRDERGEGISSIWTSSNAFSQYPPGSFGVFRDRCCGNTIVG